MATADVLSSIKSEDYRHVAIAIHQEWSDRKKRRDTLEKHWKEVDRQLRMEPETSHKMGIGSGGGLVKDKTRAWMPEVELPLQASALETLLSDVRRLRYPSTGDWFTCRAALTEQYFAKFAKAGSPFLGERGSADVVVSQDDADKLAQGFVSQLHSFYDFRGHMDLIDAQSISYGAGVGRMRRVKHRHLGFNARTMDGKEKTTPMVIPRDIKKTYLDDSKHALMHEGFALGPSVIQEKNTETS